LLSPLAKIEAQPAGATLISKAEAFGIGDKKENAIRIERKKDFMRTCVG
jgi:hypothetical protein